MSAATPPESQTRTKELPSGKWWWIGTAALIVILVAGSAAVGSAIGHNSSKSSSARLPRDQYTQMVQSGQMQQMFDQHERMLERMQIDVSPQMLSIMNADPMWKLMRSGMYTKMLEQFQQQLNQSLGRSSP